MILGSVSCYYAYNHEAPSRPRCEWALDLANSEIIQPMLTKKSKSVSVSTKDISASPAIAKPRARATTSTTKTTPLSATVADQPVKTASLVRHSSRKPMKPVDAVASSTDNSSQAIPDGEVATRAYHIWMESGCPEGTSHDNWMRAKHELSMAASQ